MMNIHYHPITGDIVAWDTSSVPQAVPGCAITTVYVALPTISTLHHKIDPLTGIIRDKTPSEVAFTLLPAEFEVRSARYTELVATDWTDTAAHLRDTEEDGTTKQPYASAEVRANWLAYRQTLRDIGALSNPVEMIEAWPVRPDGTDPIPQLRNRI